MYDDVFEAMTFLAEIAGDGFREANRDARYPWVSSMPGHRSLRAEAAVKSGDFVAFAEAAEEAGLQDLATELAALSITSEIETEYSRIDPRRSGRKICSLLMQESERHHATWTTAFRDGMQLGNRYAFSDQQFVAVKLTYVVRGFKELADWLNKRLDGPFDYQTLIAFRDLLTLKLTGQTDDGHDDDSDD